MKLVYVTVAMIMSKKVDLIKLIELSYRNMSNVVAFHMIQDSCDIIISVRTIVFMT
jgi:hypothetical protein